MFADSGGRGSSRGSGAATPSGVSMSAMLFDDSYPDEAFDGVQSALEHVSGPLKRLLRAVQLEMELEHGKTLS